MVSWCLLPLKSAVLGLFALVGKKRLAYSCYSASIHTLALCHFFFFTDPLTNDYGLGWYLQVFHIEPPRGPHE